jgi:hypothetical protein
LASKADPKRKPNPDAFRKSLEEFRALRSALVQYDGSVEDLQRAHAACALTAIGDETIAKIISQEAPLPRLTRRGVRYSDAAGVGGEDFPPIRSLGDILVALRTDLKTLTTTLDEAIAGLRDALPLADKGEFSAVMLSGRNALGDKMPQFTQMFSAYESFYIRAVGVTVTATMQLYPKGYEWLTNGVPVKK